MRKVRRRITALLLSVILILSALPAAALDQPAPADDADEARWEQYWALTPPECPAEPSLPPKRGTSTTLSAMRARAEALVNYTWTPTTDISTWNGSSYNGLNYFPAGQVVRGVPYTLFTSEIVYWGLCSLEQYEEVAAINYSTTAYCASVGAVRTGPVYGSCCADLVSEVLGGSFLYGRSPRYHNVGGVKRSPYGTTLTGQKMADIRAGDALSDVGENHIIWIGEVTKTTFTLYEQTPPAARKRILNKADFTNGAGYFIYNGKEYSIITRSNELIDGPPRYAVLSTDKQSYAPDETVTFRMNTDGTENTLHIFCPDGSTMAYEDADTVCRLGFRTAGHYQALVETQNPEGSLTGDRIDFVVGPPTRSVLSTDRPSCEKGGSLTFSIDADGEANALWIYGPDGICMHYEDVGASFPVSFKTPGHYQAMAESRNPQGALSSGRIEFTVGPPTLAAVTADKTVCQSGETVTFTVNADGDETVLQITCPDGSVQEYPYAGQPLALQFKAGGGYEAAVLARNPAGERTGGKVFFTVECSHPYEAQTVPPTCLRAGCMKHVCTVCGDGYEDEFIPALGHDYVYAVTEAPTPDAAGVLTGSCANCGGETTIPLPPLSEKHYAVSVTKPASCSEPGSASYTWNTTDYGEYCFEAALPTLEHSYEDTVIAPTCTESGCTLRVCTVCGAEHRDGETPALGHDWDGGTVTAAPTETEPGTLLRTCTRCGQTKEEIIPAPGHEHGYQEEVVSPTCTVPGYTLHVCAGCGDEYRDQEIPAHGHDYGEWTQILAASCTRAGLEARVCTRCGAREQQSVPALGHQYETSVVAPTCTAPGCTLHQCVRCGDSDSELPTDPTGHAFEYSVTTQPTAAHPGTLTGVCRLCGAEEPHTMPPLNEEDYAVSRTEAANCAGPGFTEYTWVTSQFGETVFTVPIAAELHQYAEKVTAPSCTGYGYTTFTCAACGESHRGAYTPALDHDWNAGLVSVAPTQTAAGVRTFVCSICGAGTMETIPPLVHEHSYVENVMPATCTKAGYTFWQCSCGVNYIDSEVAALGHDWDGGAVAVEPTWAGPGQMLYTCTRCGLTRTEMIPKLWDPAHPCDGGDTCSGKIFSDMPPAGNWAHDAIDWAVDHGITSGTSKTAFSPNAGCTRAQVVTFLWRAAGSPEPASADTDFTDVKQGSFYSKAVAWAVEQEITRGTAPAKFSPDAACTRAQVVAFLWRMEGQPDAQTTFSFEDVPAGAYYAGAVAWAVEQSVTNGVSPTRFAPGRECTRAQIVVFLFRDLEY